MKSLTAIQAKAVDDYRKFLVGGATYAHSMQSAAKALGGTPCPTLLAALAAVHAEQYKCNFTWDGKGSAVFYIGKESTRESRHDAARKSWARNVMVWFTPTREAKPTKHNRISAEARSAAKAYLAQFDNVAEAIKVLRAVAK